MGVAGLGAADMDAVELTITELQEAGELDLGVSRWRRLSQSDIDTFAELTDDHMWLHVDPARARQGPFGTTVAHGYLTLSLLPSLLGEVLTVSDMRGRVNYGIDRLRFTAPVRSDAEVRARVRLIGSERRGERLLYRLEVTVEIKDDAKPALVGDLLFLVF